VSDQVLHPHKTTADCKLEDNSAPNDKKHSLTLSK
jgi:hypothetical protein